jgi:hypothetical protein
MDKAIIASTLAMLAVACGPEVGDEDDVPGTLVYEDSYTRLYRLDRRIDIIIREEHGERRECGLMTDRALEELESTLAGLDAAVDYGDDPETLECSPTERIYIEGFDHSPFECNWQCCHPDLQWVAVVYNMVINNVYGGTPTIDGEPYVAIEPDQPCP